MFGMTVGHCSHSFAQSSGLGFPFHVFCKSGGHRVFAVATHIANCRVGLGDTSKQRRPMVRSGSSKGVQPRTVRT